MTDLHNKSCVENCEENDHIPIIATTSDLKSENLQSSESNDKKQRKPSRISAQVWERFQSLQTRADNLTKRSTEKRVKHLQKQILDTVKEKLSTEEERCILREHKVELDSKKTGCPSIEKPSSSADSIGSTNDGYQQQIKKYLGMNDHMKAGDRCGGSGGRRSGLEREIDKAVARGDVKSAEELSDRLASRDFAVKITEAASAREYLKRKKEEEEYIKSKKKKKLNWGFEHKQRWETKSNM